MILYFLLLSTCIKYGFIANTKTITTELFNYQHTLSLYNIEKKYRIYAEGIKERWEGNNGWGDNVQLNYNFGWKKEYKWLLTSIFNGAELGCGIYERTLSNFKNQNISSTLRLIDIWIPWLQETKKESKVGEKHIFEVYLGGELYTTNWFKNKNISPELAIYIWDKNIGCELSFNKISGYLFIEKIKFKFLKGGAKIKYYKEKEKKVDWEVTPIISLTF